MSDLLVAKAREFTDTENLALVTWLIADNVGLYDLAFRLLDTGLMFEHYRSLLSEDPAKITEEQAAELEVLRRAFQANLDEFEANKKIKAAKRFRAFVDRLRAASGRLGFIRSLNEVMDR